MTAPVHPHASARLQWLRAALLLSALCAGRAPAAEPESEQAVARFYWPYAAMAAEVYRSRGVSDLNIAVALASPWLRQQIQDASHEEALARLERLGYAEAERLYQVRLHQKCEQEKAESRAEASALPACILHLQQHAQALRTAEEDRAETNRFEDSVPTQEADCDVRGGADPFVPVQRITRGEQGWTRVPELQKYAPAGHWRLFVPDLAIDVWRRKRSAGNEALVMEYAIVFRGTVGGGGWVSNLRVLTTMAPFFVWDQYRQARDAADAIMEQVRRTHAIRDELLGAPRTTLFFTTVGHSLGGGLAQDVFLRNPRISKVVAFDASPANGSSSIAIAEREGVMNHVLRTADPDRLDPQASIHLFYEHGSVLGQLVPCHPGPLWGAEGGPAARCDRVNFSHGNAFRQHNMAQMACKLFLRTREAGRDWVDAR